MPSPFARDLCGWRANAKPNTSDASDAFSVALGEALFEAMGVDRHARGDAATGGPFALRVAEDLGARLPAKASTVLVQAERPMTAFEQYRHVGALRRLSAEPSTELTKAWGRIKAHVRALDEREPSSSPWERLIGDMEQALTTERDQRSLLLEEAGDESILGLDVAISRSLGQGPPHLEAGLSLKWSLRTDRAQDCRSQGAKLAALRRGRMPHFAAVTMEPRPYMLNLLGGGSGEIDCVYHLDLPALSLAIESTCAGNQARRKAADTFRRLVGQRRLRDYDELVAFVEGLA